VSLSVAAEPVPFIVGADGVARIGGTRVTLDTVVRAFERGESAEQIGAAYPVLRPADVYAVIAYYLRHRAEVEEYLRFRQRQVEDAHRLIESQPGRTELHERLKARRSSPPDASE
jgi:uncharacterized protein (DUF433 family)